MTSTRAINAAAGVIHACMQQGKTLPASQAYALESAGLLNSPEIAAELVELRKLPTEVLVLRTDLDAFREQRNAVFRTNERLLSEAQESEQARLRAENDVRTVKREADALRARVVELEALVGDGSTRTADEDPIRFSLTPEALHAASGAVIEIPDRPRDGVYPQGTAHRQQMRDLIAGQRAALGNHDGPPHHDYRTGRDLPEVTP